ncbi:PQQ-binding-like beta-propeller repeat protein [Pseudomonas sp. TMP25]|uniref:outer membrane protein assembly factor BamB family protein n=1 Tax=Pseudomonas sp. TMP25 TaxID=3136561 RepID=UPI0031016A55
MSNLKIQYCKSACAIFITFLTLSGCNSESSIEAKLRGSDNNSGVYDSEAPTTINEIVWKFRPSRQNDFMGSIVAGNSKAYIVDFRYRTLYAIDVQAGEEAWRWESDEEIGQPEYNDGAVYVGTQGGEFYSIDSASGNERWSFKGVERMVYTPAINGRTVYVSDAEGMRAIDIKTGQLNWSFIVDGPSAGVTVDGNVLYFATKNYLFSVNKDTGKELWRTGIKYSRIGQPKAPVLLGNDIYINSMSEIYRVDKNTGQIIWSKEVSGIMNSAVAASNGKIFFGVWGGAAIDDFKSGYIKSIATDDGAALWEFKLNKGTGSSPSVSGDNVYIGDWSGTLFALDSNTGEALWDFKGIGAISGAPAIFGGSIIIGGDEGVFRLK